MPHHPLLQPVLVPVLRNDATGQEADELDLDPDRWVQATLLLGIVLAFVWFVTA